jgi:hypothetical protein
LSPRIRDLEVTIKSYKTYMSLTDAFFKQTVCSIFRQCCEKGTRERWPPGPAHAEATALVGRHWRAILRVAAALEERGTLTGFEITVLMRLARDGC